MPKRIPKPFADCLRCTKQRLLTPRRLCASCDTRYYSYKLRLSKEDPNKAPSVEEFILSDPARKSSDQSDTELLPTTELIPGFMISSPAMRQVVHKLQRAAARDVSVLIVGETGVGKEYVARAIHDLSPRKGRPFVTIDSPSLTPDLASSELFGHEPGAFTGARAATHGLFGQADGGTVFLDELSALQMDIQPKLLRALESKTIRRVGGCADKNIDVRMISATNVPLRTLVEDRRFRPDLLYRLNVFPITIPPLRERRTDIAILAERFLFQFEGGAVTLSAAATNALNAYPWPGNVRELYHAIQYATIMQEGGVITKDHLPEEVLFPERALLEPVTANFH
jgi:DNA-binding NtrC family response regulator